MHEFLRFLAMMGAFTWLMAGIVSVAIVATYSDEIKKSAITRTEVLLGGVLTTRVRVVDTAQDSPTRQATDSAAGRRAA